MVVGQNGPLNDHLSLKTINMPPLTTNNIYCPRTTSDKKYKNIKLGCFYTSKYKDHNNRITASGNRNYWPCTDVKKTTK